MCTIQSVSGGGQRGVSVGGAPLATLEEGEREDSSTASDDDTSLVHISYDIMITSSSI